MSGTDSGDDRNGPAPRTVSEERPLRGMRKTIARRLGESYRNAVHVTASRTVDAGALVDAADAAPEAVTITDVVLAALSETLTDHPAFNATFEDDTHLLYEEQNVGVAVDIDAGLVTPVLADLANRSLESIATERRRLTDAVQSGDYSMSDMRNGTFTLSNLGPLGVDSFSPVINPPEVAVLGVGRMNERVRPGEDGVVVRPLLTFDLSFDHRVVDGADAARFLSTLAENVETAEGYVGES